jgi:acylphosphatase
MSERRRLHAYIRGEVQGVGFRYFVRQRAGGLAGWVRNLKDGRVELVAEGAAEALEAFLEVVRLGPHGSGVEDVQVEWAAASGEFHRFDIKPTI